jgi:ankyrin repeat protein
MINRLNKKMIALLVFLSFSVIPAYSMGLLEAASAGDVARVEELIADGADLEMRGDAARGTPLHYAIHGAIRKEDGAERHLAIVNRLLAAGAEVDAVDKYGNTPLSHASHIGIDHDLPFVQALLTAGADVCHENLAGETALHRAAMSYQPEIVQELINAGAQVNHPNKYGETPVHYTAQNELCFKGVALILETLLNNGGDVNRQDIAGETPLHKAVPKHLDEGMVVFLLAHKADPSIKNYQGKIPSDRCKEYLKLDKTILKLLDKIIIKLIERGTLPDLTLNVCYNGYKINERIYMQLMQALKHVKDNGHEIGAILALATHNRLGKDSPVQLLPQGLIATIAHMAAVQEQGEFVRHPERPSLSYTSLHKIRTWFRSPIRMGISALGLITLGSIFAYGKYSHIV